MTIKLGDRMQLPCWEFKKKRNFARSDRDKFSAWEFTRATCQRFDVNLTMANVSLI